MEEASKKQKAYSIYLLPVVEGGGVGLDEAVESGRVPRVHGDQLGRHPQHRRNYSKENH